MRAWVLGNRWWSSTRSPPPVLALSLVAWVKVHALVGASRGRVPGFHKLAFIFRRSVSHDVSSVPVEGVAVCETVQGEERILILSSDGAFVFLHMCTELPNGLAHEELGHSEHGILYTTFRCFCAGRLSFTRTNVLRSDCVGLCAKLKL